MPRAPLRRVPEPELMDTPAQARAYAEADFSEPNTLFVALFVERFSPLPHTGVAVDLGCGPGDIPVRFARRFPGWRVDAVDGGPNMLSFARAAVEGAGLADRVQVLRAMLPDDPLPRTAYDAVISNSLLHHLASPLVLWRAVRAYARSGAPVLVMDLARPASAAAVDGLVSRYAADAPPVLAADFRNSLCAAYRVDEVRDQIQTAGLAELEVGMVSDRHLAVWGNLR